MCVLMAFWKGTVNYDGFWCLLGHEMKYKSNHKELMVKLTMRQIFKERKTPFGKLDHTFACDL